MYSQDFDTGLTGLLQGLSFAKGIHFDQERLKLEKEAMELQRERQGVLNDYQRELTGGLKLQNEQNRELLTRGREHDGIQQLFESTGIDMTKGFDITSLNDEQNVQFASLVNTNPTLKNMFNEMVGVPEGTDGFFGGVVTAPDGSLQARVIMPDARGRRTTSLMPISKEDADFVNARVNQIASRGNFGATDIAASQEYENRLLANENAEVLPTTVQSSNTTVSQTPLGAAPEQQPVRQKPELTVDPSLVILPEDDDKPRNKKTLGQGISDFVASALKTTPEASYRTRAYTGDNISPPYNIPTDDEKPVDKNEAPTKPLVFSDAADPTPGVRIPRTSAKEAVKDPVKAMEKQGPINSEQQQRAEEIVSRGPEVKKYTRTQVGLPMLRAGLWSPEEYKTYVSTGYRNELEAKIATQKTASLANQAQARKYYAEAEKSYAERAAALQGARLDNEAKALANEKSRRQLVKDSVMIGVNNPNFVTPDGRKGSELTKEEIESYANEMYSDLIEAQEQLSGYGVVDKNGKPYDLFDPKHANDLTQMVHMTNLVNDKSFTGYFEEDLTTEDIVVGNVLLQLKRMGYGSEMTAAHRANTSALGNIPIVREMFGGFIGLKNAVGRTIGLVDESEQQQLVAFAAEMHKNYGIHPNKTLLGFVASAEEWHKQKNEKLSIDKYTQRVLEQMKQGR